MNITMDLNEARFTLTDLIKLGTAIVTVVIFAITIKANLGNLTDKVSEIRETQMENTKKNDLRWETISLEINQLKLNQSLMDQRIKALELRK